MSERDIIQNMIRALGQAQSDRVSRELAPDFASVDERTPEELLAFMRGVATRIQHYGADPATPDGDWGPFFPSEEGWESRLRADRSGTVPAHLALIAAFVELYQLPRAAMNGITGRHLDFFYERALGFARRGARPDRAHLLVIPKKNVGVLRIERDQLFTAGKDEAGTELVYASTRETTAVPAEVASIRTIFVDQAAGAVRFAPAAASADGVGGPLRAEDPSWPAFGHSTLPEAEVGFAVASPVLRMSEGARKISIVLALGSGASVPEASALQAGLEAFVTGETQWLSPRSLQAMVSGETLALELELAADAGPVVDYDPAVHGYAYTAGAPIVQVLLKGGGAAVGYDAIRTLTVRTVEISVTVDGITSLSLESDVGQLDPRRVFQPFGPEPKAGARFMVGCPEALGKRLSSLTLDVTWHGLPSDLRTYYDKYEAQGVDDGYFTATVRFRDAGSWEAEERGVTLFAPRTAPGAWTKSFKPPQLAASAAGLWSAWPHALARLGTSWGKLQAARFAMRHPVWRYASPSPPPARPGFVTLTLEKDFLHSLYRKQTISNTIRYAKGEAIDGTPIALVVLNEPYTPAARAVSLSYSAHSELVDLASPSKEAFASGDVEFFHVGPFGQRREHAWLRSELGFVPDARVTLVPAFEDEGELLVGLSGIGPGDGVSMLFQVSEGSADPEAPRAPVRWSVLSDNQWKPLGPDDLALDTTNELLASGAVRFAIPLAATTQNTLLPAGLVWLRASVADGAEAMSRLVAIATNAVEVELRDPDAHPDHLRTPLPPGRIVKPKLGLAAARAVSQPYSSFGGRPAETPEALRMRAAERLRHRGRAVTPWDYERLVLEAFPELHLVKCVPHADGTRWLTPGHVLVVVVPDLRNRNARDPLQPRADADTLARVEAFLRERAGMQVQLHVKNPRYQRVRLDLKVRYRPGEDFNSSTRRLRRELIAALSPWVGDVDRPPVFGGSVHRSVLLEIAERQPYVDYVTEFKMYSFADPASPREDVAEARALAPDAILVSDRDHAIAAVTP
jgi:hypothetical protein